MPIEIPVLKKNIRSTFNKNQVISNLSRLERRALSRAGSYVAETARRSLKKSRRQSRPGQPPYSHTEKLRNMIRTAVDSNRVMAIAGVLRRYDVESEGLAPPALEHGGVTKFVPSKGRKYRPGDYGVMELGRGNKTIQLPNGGTTKAVLAKIKTPEQLERANENLRKMNELASKKKTVTIAARPFMGPALMRSQQAITSFFNESGM